MDYACDDNDLLDALLERWGQKLTGMGLSDTRVRTGYLGRVSSYLIELRGELTFKVLRRLKREHIEDEFLGNIGRLDNADLWMVLTLFFDFAVGEGVLSESPMKAKYHPTYKSHPMRGTDSLEAFLEAWLFELRKGVVAKTLVGHRATVLRLMMSASVPLTEQGVAQLSLAHVQDYFLEHPRTRMANQRVIWVMFSDLLDHAVKMGVMTQNPIEDTWPTFKASFVPRVADNQGTAEPQGELSIGLLPVWQTNPSLTPRRFRTPRD